MNYEIRYACGSHIGNYRRTNEDNFVCAGRHMEQGQRICLPWGHNRVHTGGKAVFGVFDGIGGLKKGDAAARMAAEQAAELNAEGDVLLALWDYCQRANRSLWGHGEWRWGTTAALLAFGEKEIFLCNAGDTKIFRITDGVIKEISKEHSSRTPERQRLLTQSLGAQEEVRPYFSKGAYQHGDRYLICSDGLTDMVSEAEILEIAKQEEFDGVARALIEKALEKGGKDNITVILCAIEEIKRGEQKWNFGQNVGRNGKWNGGLAEAVLATYTKLSEMMRQAFGRVRSR